MSSAVRTVTAAVLAIVLIVAMIVESSSRDWASPLLGLLVGYVIGDNTNTGVA